MERFFRLVVRLYPPGFRRRYGEPMVEVFRQQWAQQTARSRWRRALLAGQLAIDFVSTASRAWLAALRPDPRPKVLPSRSTPMDRLFQDLRYALRSFARRPGFTAVLVVTLGLGIGANTAIFTLVNEVVLRPLRIGDPKRVVDIVAEVPGGNSFTGFSFAEYLAYRDRAGDALSGVSATTAGRLRLGPGIDAERVSGQFVTENYFDVLAVAMQAGQTMAPGGDPMVAVVSHAFWQSRMGGAPNAVGSTLRLNDTPFTVIGVAGEGFNGTFIGFPTEMWLPLRAGELILPSFDLEDPAARGLECIGRLAPGVDLGQAQAVLDVLAVQLQNEGPMQGQKVRASVHPTTGVDRSMRGGVLGFLALLMTVAGLVLLITCLNVGGMLLVKAAARQREMAIRFAMGAGAGRLTRQLLTETLVVFALGGALGAFVATRLTDALLAMISDLPAPRGLELGIDWRVLAFTAAAALIASLVAGIFPAREALRQDPVTGLRATRGADEGHSAGRLRRAFVVAQIAAAVALLTGAGLLLRSLREGRTLDPGFEADLVAAVPLSLSEEEYGRQRGILTWEQLRGRVARIPGVESVAVARRKPIDVVKHPVAIEVPGVEAPADGTGFLVDANTVSAAYFATMRIPLLSGRDFRPDEGLDAARVAIVNETMARRFWNRSDATGRQLMLGGERVTVVGVAGDSRTMIQDDTPISHVYLPMAQDYSPRMTLLVRAAGDPTRLQREVRGEILAVAPSLFPRGFATLRRDIDASLLPQRLASTVMMALGSFGLLLASLGIYGILAHGVNQRAREIGIRLALGGRPWEVVQLIVRSGLRLVAIGLAAGTAVALAMTPLLRMFLVGVAVVDLPTLAVVSAVFLVVGGVACLLPAVRASRIDPTVSLRLE